MSATTSTSGSSLTPTKQQQFDYFLVLDFEATCQEGSKIPPYQEIIEFPVAKLNSRTWQVESQFRQFVCPSTNPVLTPFCTQLTGITQEMVTNQPPLADVMKNFDEWLHNEGLLPKGNFLFITCGDWDLKTQLPTETAAKGIPMPDYFSRWVNVKKATKRCGYSSRGMMSLLNELGIPHQGRHHSGMDDVLNICSIVRAIGVEGYCFAQRPLPHANRTRKAKKDEPASSTPVEQRFDYFLVLDFEATCQKGSPLLPYQEIIEFPCAKLNSRTWEVESRFRQFACPSVNPELTPYCTELTGITQEMVENQPPLAEVLKNFDEWMRSEGLLPNGNFAFVTCGDWDLKVQLPTETAAKSITMPDYFSRHINVKKAARRLGYSAWGMMPLLNELEIPHQGHHHSGIDDVENICSIVRALAGKGHIFGSRRSESRRR